MYLRFIRLTPLLFSFFIVGGLQAQPQSFLTQEELSLSRPTSNQQLPAVRIGLDEGLSQSSIYAIHQDQQGFMWFGTEAGLNKYDGYSFTVYKNIPGDSTSISSGVIYFIHEDQEGDLWLATNDGGLNRMDPATGQFTRYFHDADDPSSLSGSGVSLFHESADGTLWVGTNHGLNRYDRETHTFTRFLHDPEDPNTLSRDRISFLFEDASGLLWVISTGQGQHVIDRLNPQTGQVNRLRDNPEAGDNLAGDLMINWGWANRNNTSFLEDSRGLVWIGTYDSTLTGVLNRYDPETQRFTQYRHDPDHPGRLGPGILGTIHEDQSGRIWAVNWRTGLNRYDPETDEFTHYEAYPPNASRSHTIVQLYEDRRGTLWLNTFLEDKRGEDQDIIRLERFDPETGQFHPLAIDPTDPMTPNVTITNILGEDDAGQLWLSASGEGLDRYDPVTGTFTHYTNDPNDPRSLSDNRINRFYSDHTGMLWFGTATGGISKIDPHPPKFSHVRYDPSDPGSLSSPAIWSFLEDREGILWVGTNAGLDRYDPETGDFSHYSHLPVLPNRVIVTNPVYRILEDRGGTLWVGMSQGLYQFNRETGAFSNVPIDPNQPEAFYTIRDLYEDPQGVLWVGTTWGLHRHDLAAGQHTVYRIVPDDSASLSHNNVSTIYEDYNGILWVGTSNGLNRFDRDSETFTRFYHEPDDPNSLSSNAVISIYSAQDEPDILWFGTLGGGLNRFDVRTGASTRYMETTSDLPDNVVYAILPDEAGNLWMSTNNGLTRFDPRTEVFKTYDTDDGLQSKEFSSRSALVASNGAMFFGGVNGFNIFYPEQVQDDLDVPRIALKNLHVYNASNDTATTYEGGGRDDAALVLPHDENDLTFSYAALHYTNPEKNQYRYRLDPYEATWSDPSTQRQARYANLDPGTYTFQLQASNSDGIWNEEGLNFAFEVRPPWWQTVWAYVLYGFLFVVGVFAVDRVQRRRLLRRAELEQAQLRAEAAELQAKATEAEAQALQAENRRKTQELEAARALQLAMLPEAVPEHPTFALAAYMQTATEVGGDYYDFDLTEDSTLTLAIGDATGHGTKAGTMVTAAKSLFMHCARDQDLTAVLSESTKTLKRMKLPKLYMALALARLRDDTLELAGAGMPPALVYRTATRSVESIPLKGIPLGGPVGIPYQKTSVTLSPGDTVLLMSDGFPELFNEAREMFGYERAVSVFEEVAHQSTEDIIAHFTKTAADWMNNGPQDDDVTFIVIKMKS